MTNLLIEPTREAAWHHLVQDACMQAQCGLSDELKAYTAFMLMRNLNNSDLASIIFAIEYLTLQNKKGVQRRDGLRDAADGCVLIAGLFPGLAHRRLVKVSYYTDFAQVMYQELAGGTTGSFASMFRALSESVVDIMKLLMAARDINRSPISHDVLSAMEELALTHPSLQ